MRSIAFTALFFLLALFSAVAYAAPVVPEGAISKRQQCLMGTCKDAVAPATTTTPATSLDATDPNTVIGQILAAFYEIIAPSSSAPAAAFAVPTTSTSSTQPTGL